MSTQDKLPPETEQASIISNPEVREHLEKLRVIYARQMGGARPPLGLKDKSTNVRKKRGPRKISTTLRISHDVLAAFRATGRGWQTRMDEALRKIMENDEM